MTPEEIKSFRKLKSLTQSDLGERCGVGKSSVSQWESGATEPSGAARTILEELMSGARSLFPLTALEERYMEEAVRLSGLDRETLLESIVLDLIRRGPGSKSKTRGKKAE
jgi:transcriptional regulator with XRE-family HTH domain